MNDDVNMWPELPLHLSAHHDVFESTPESTNSQPNLSDDILCMMEPMINRWPMHKASPLLLVYPIDWQQARNKFALETLSTDRARRSIMSESQRERSLNGNMVAISPNWLGKFLGKQGRALHFSNKEQKKAPFTLREVSMLGSRFGWSTAAEMQPSH